MTSNVTVKKSSIHGQGVFAARDFTAGDVVVSWKGFERITREQYEQMAQEKQDKVCVLDGEYIVMREPACFVNHSCDPNTKPTPEGDAAIRAIAPGEEITSDYAFVLPPGTSLSCKCGSPKCRGEIRAL